MKKVTHIKLKLTKAISNLNLVYMSCNKLNSERIENNKKRERR